MKKILSIAIASAVIMSAASAVCAADYGNKPDYTLPPSATTPVVTEKPAKEEALPPIGTSLKNPQILFDKKDVQDAVMNDEPVYASYEQADIKSNAMAALARVKDGKLTVITKRYTATIKSETITEAKDISLAIEMTKNTAKGAMILRTEQEGDFGCEVELNITAKYYSQCKVDLNKAHFYYVDNDTKKVTDIGRIKLDENGNIVVKMVKGGKYIIM